MLPCLIPLCNRTKLDKQLPNFTLVLVLLNQQSRILINLEGHFRDINLLNKTYVFNYQNAFDKSIEQRFTVESRDISTLWFYEVHSVRGCSQLSFKIQT